MIPYYNIFCTQRPSGYLIIFPKSASYHIMIHEFMITLTKVLDSYYPVLLTSFSTLILKLDPSGQPFFFFQKVVGTCGES